MGELSAIPIGGVEALLGDELVGFDSALEAHNCYVDDGQISGRNGYRSILPSATAIGSGSDVPQGVWRFRPSLSSARTIVVAAGTVYLVTDRSAEGLSDGTVTSLGNVFGATATVSGVQSGRYFYLFSDESPTKSVRITPSYTLEVMTSLSAPTDVTHTLAKPQTVRYTMTPVTSTSPACYVSHVSPGGATYSDFWFVYGSPTQRTRPPQGGYLTFDLGATQDWSSYAYIACMVSPRRSWASSDHPVVTIEVSADNTSYAKIGEVYDGLPEEKYGPTVAYLPLTGMGSEALQQVRYVRYTLSNAGEVWGSQGCFWGVYGHCLIAMVSGVGTYYYKFTAKNSSTGVRSPMSGTADGYAVTVTKLSKDDVPKYHSLSCDKANGGVEDYTDHGTCSVDYTSEPTYRIANYNMGLALPPRDKWSGIPTLTCAIPVDSRYPNADTIELWRMTPNGWRLAGTKTLTGGETTVSITDGGGDVVQSAELYQPFGSQQRAYAACARAGARLVAGLSNQLSISSYIAPGETADPIPSWPPTATEDWHGWSFQIAPSTAEQIISLQDGDYLYVLTNLAVHTMLNVQPGSPFYKSSAHGCVGRNAAIVCELGLVYASADAIYVLDGRGPNTELTQRVRRLYASWFAPNSSVVLGYQNRKLYAFCGSKYMRYDIVTGTWTTGTIAGTVAAAASWVDPGNPVVERLCLLFTDRRVALWESSATSDLMFGATAGTSIQNWLYSTGMAASSVKTKVGRFLVDATGTVRVGIARTADGGLEREKVVEQGQDGAPRELPAWSDASSYQWRVVFQAANGVRLRRAMWSRDGLDAMGGAKA